MAIGKVNAYATVEGTPTDFGKMTVDAIDRYNAEEQKREAVKAAEAKVRTERQKEVKAFSGAGVSGNTTIDDVILPTVYSHGDLYAENVKKYAETGEIQYKLNAEKIQSTVDLYKTVPTTFLSKLDEINQGVTNKKLNSNYASDALNFGRSISGGKMKVEFDENYNPIAKVYETDEDGNLTGKMLKEVPVMGLIKELNIPGYYSKEDNVKDFKANNQMVLNEFYNTARTMKTGVKELTPALQANIDYAAKSASLNDDAMAQLMIDGGFGKKIGGYTKTDRENVEGYYKKYLTNTFQGEVSKDYTRPAQPSGGGDGSKKEKFKPITFNPINSFFQIDAEGKVGKFNYGKGARSQALTISDSSPKAKAEDQIIISNLKIYAGKKAIAEAANALVTDLVYDQAGRLVATGTYTDVKASKTSSTQKNLLIPGEKTAESADDADMSQTYGTTFGEERNTFTQVLGKSQVSAVLSKLIGKVITAPDGEDITIRNENDLKRAMGYKKPTGAPANKATTKKYNDIQEQAIARGLKANPGYSREEIISALKLK